MGEDSLNLWRGKRLTHVERKVEQQLHVSGANHNVLPMQVVARLLWSS